jgi:hypothetical protein
MRIRYRPVNGRGICYSGQTRYFTGISYDMQHASSRCASKLSRLSAMSGVRL